MTDPELTEARRRKELVDTLLMMTVLVSAQDRPGSLVSRLKANMDAEGQQRLESLTAKDFEHRQE